MARAVWNDRLVTAAYKERLRTLEPYGLVLKAGAWYLAARSRSRFLIFRVDRFGPVEVGEAGFDRDSGFDLAAFWAEQSAWFTRSLLRTEITLRLSPRGVRLLRHIADPAALAGALGSLRPDGTVRLAVESVEVAYGQVLRFGPEAEVLGPPQLRALAAEAAARMSGLYGTGQARTAGWRWSSGSPGRSGLIGSPPGRGRRPSPRRP
ncbi:WYL domain-containing protein [Nonomuraea sp. NPDC048916]|uniref:WYL domain-containing protein n=1 Tax=Nonomuraea sp. NPDC048916 TaxID=3154232 RepID=UPI00340A5B38